MKGILARGFAVSVAVSSLLLVAGAQERPASTDPRVGLKPGLKDAGFAARNMELVATLPKPEGFFDPKAPAGRPTGPEREGRGRGGDGAGHHRDSC